jgi:hypothetical protein
LAVPAIAGIVISLPFDFTKSLSQSPRSAVCGPVPGPAMLLVFRVFGLRIRRRLLVTSPWSLPTSAAVVATSWPGSLFRHIGARSRQMFSIR